MLWGGDYWLGWVRLGLFDVIHSWQTGWQTSMVGEIDSANLHWAKYHGII